MLDMSSRTVYNESSGEKVVGKEKPMECRMYMRVTQENYTVPTEVGDYTVETRVTEGFLANGDLWNVIRNMDITTPVRRAHHIYESSTYMPRALKLIADDVAKKQMKGAA